jgi:hypothetical protein
MLGHCHLARSETKPKQAPQGPVRNLSDVWFVEKSQQLFLHYPNRGAHVI